MIFVEKFQVQIINYFTLAKYDKEKIMTFLFMYKQINVKKKPLIPPITRNHYQTETRPIM